MKHETSKPKALLRDWLWILVVSLLLAIPTYGFSAPIHYALLAHIIATLVYVGLLLLYGDGFVIEGALAVLILATLFAFCSRPLHRAIHHVRVEASSSHLIRGTLLPSDQSIQPANKTLQFEFGLPSPPSLGLGSLGRSTMP